MSSASARALAFPATARWARSPSPRYVSQVQRVLDREHFDLLHFHEPFVPFLSLVVLRQSSSVNIATFHAYAGFSPAMELGKRTLASYSARLHGRIAVSAAAGHFADLSLIH